MRGQVQTGVGAFARVAARTFADRRCTAAAPSAPRSVLDREFRRVVLPSETALERSTGDHCWSFDLAWRPARARRHRS